MFSFGLKSLLGIVLEQIQASRHVYYVLLLLIRLTRFYYVLTMSKLSYLYSESVAEVFLRRSEVGYS